MLTYFNLYLLLLKLFMLTQKWQVSGDKLKVGSLTWGEGYIS